MLRWVSAGCSTRDPLALRCRPPSYKFFRRFRQRGGGVRCGSKGKNKLPITIFGFDRIKPLQLGINGHVFSVERPTDVSHLVTRGWLPTFFAFLPVLGMHARKCCFLCCNY